MAKVENGEHLDKMKHLQLNPHLIHLICIKLI